MKRRLLVLMIIGLMVFASACGSSSKNEGASSTGTTETAGTTESGGTSEGGSSNSPEIRADAAGISIPMPKTYQDNRDKTYLYYDGAEVEDGLFLLEGYLYPATLDALQTMSDDDYMTAEENTINAFNIIKAKEADWPIEDLDKWCDWFLGLSPGSLEEVGTYEDETGKYKCYANFGIEIPEGLSDEMKPIFEGIVSELTASKGDIKFYEAVDMSLMYTGNKISFTSKDVNGNEVNSEEIFGKCEYTLVNFWASWCGPCIQELPELEEINKEFQEKGCQVIGVLMDGDTEAGLTEGKDILTDTGVTYTNVIKWENSDDQVHIQYYPTSFVVDSTGTIVGASIVGANVQGYRDAINQLKGE